MTDLDTYTARILAIWHEATEDERTDGVSWYARAYDLACELCPSDPRAGAGVIAVLSPMTSWSINVRNARLAFAGCPVPTLSANAAKARAIVNGASPDKVVSGLKVTAFFRAICGEDGPATIDRHAGDICVGRPCTDPDRADALKRGGRKLMQAAYAQAARELGIGTHDVQAVTWIAWRRLHATQNRAGVIGYRAVTPLVETVHAELSEAIATVVLSASRELDELTGWARADWSFAQTEGFSEFVTDTLPNALAALTNGGSESVSINDPLHGNGYGVSVQRG